MILSALAACYDRLLAEGAVEPPGFQEKDIAWVITLDADGHALGLTRTGDGKRAARFKVPAEVKRSVNIAANLLWDNAEYVLGVARTGATEKQAAKVPLRHAAFRGRLAGLPDSVKADAGVAAVGRFLERGDLSRLQADEQWAGMVAGGANVSFRLDGDRELVCERAAVRGLGDDAAEEGVAVPCLPDGDRAVPARLHPSIRGVRGAQSSGASLVSFNLPAFTSHGWEQGANAPVAERAAQAYGAALNHLLSTRERRFVEGDTTFVFWGARKTVVEDGFAHLFGYEAHRDVESDGAPVRQTLGAIRAGLAPSLEDDTPFFILGLAPNAARLAVRFWHQGPVKDIADAILRHFDRLAIDGLNNESSPPALRRLVAATAPDSDPKRLRDELRGRLSTELMAAIVKGTRYPATLLARTIERCRAEQGKRDPRTDKHRQSVTTLRAALIKAILISHGKEATVSLDQDNTASAYLLGQLFAVMENIQYHAQSRKTEDGKREGINVTIRDKFFSAAMTSPRAVFPQLEKLKNAHIKKLRRDDPKKAASRDKIIRSIFGGLKGTAESPFPPFLSIDEQGLFILGYHHQRNKFFAAHQAGEDGGETDTIEID